MSLQVEKLEGNMAKLTIEVSAEDFEAAVSNYEAGFYKVAINRSYYAIFHAIRAVYIRWI